MSIEQPPTDGQTLQKSRKVWMKRGCLSCGGAVIAAVIIVGIFSAVSGGESVKAPSPFNVSSNVVTLEEYQKIQNGMSYAEVVEIIGQEGTETGSNKIDGVPGVMPSIETKSYMWQNSNGSNLLVIFQNDRLFQKNQALLK